MLLMLAYTVLLPGAIYLVVGRALPGALTALHYIVSTSYGLTSGLLLWETFIAFRRRSAPVPVQDVAELELPPCTAIVAAYLPNEQDIILDTLNHLLNQVAVEDDRLEVILAYNRPEPLPIESALQALAGQDTRLRLLCVEGSRSKAENVNAALEVAQGTIVAIFDADHLPEPHCFQKAWRWLSPGPEGAPGYDAVQGRCVVRNDTDNWLTRLVAIEFESMYAIMHLGRSLLTDTAIFGGSNGFWRTEVLRTLRMDRTKLTEDIDCSLRALLAGHRLIHDRSIRSDELATVAPGQWWFQRKRWAQGWFQVSRKYWREVLTTAHLSPGQKALWLYTLIWLQVYPLLAQQLLPLMLAAHLLGLPIGWLANPYFVVTTIVALLSGPVLTLATYQRTLWRSRARLRWWFPIYALTQLLYSTIKNWVVLVAQQQEFEGQDEWIVTQRLRPLVLPAGIPPARPSA